MTTFSENFSAIVVVVPLLLYGDTFPIVRHARCSFDTTVEAQNVRKTAGRTDTESSSNENEPQLATIEYKLFMDCRREKTRVIEKNYSVQQQ